MARPRKPDAVKALQGTLRKDRINYAAPVVRGCAVPPAPREFNKDERRAWDQLRPALDELGVYTVADEMALRLLAKSLALVNNPGDTPPHVYVGLLRAASALLQRFGLDPASRSKVSSLKGKPEDNAEDFLFQGLRAVNGGKQ